MTNAIAVAMTNMVVSALWMSGLAEHTALCTNTLSEARLQEGGTITEIRESVVLVTNTTPEIVREIIGWQSNPCPDNMPGCTVFHGSPVYGPEREKVETTTVTEVTTLRFRWNGVACEQKREREVSRKVRKWAKRDEWVEVEP